MTAVRLLDVFPAQHGTSYAYWQGCRCPECRASRAAYARDYRRRTGPGKILNPVAYNGQIYASENEAARALGKNGETIRYHLNRHGDLSRLGMKSGGKGRKRNGIGVKIGVHQFPSRAALARHIGLPARAVTRWISKGDMDPIIAALMKADAKAAALQLRDAA